jgi:tRNA (guanine10-N2)-dimethyltransferase
LRAVIIRDPDNELAAAECKALTGAAPDSEGVADAATVAYVPRAAYVRHGVQLLATGRDLAELVVAVAACDTWADGFSIDFRGLRENGELTRREAIIAVADAMGAAKPDLRHPTLRLLLAEQTGEVWLGEIVTEPDKSYDRHDAKPHRTSASLASRMARALVNLAGPDATSIVDPCCGTGSILLEACHLGLSAVGADRSKRCFGMSSKNVAHFGYAARVEHADASDLSAAGADAVVTDLPYGRNLVADPDNIRGILEACVATAPIGVFVAGEDITEVLGEVGYGAVSLHRVRKYNAFTRFIHRAERD